MVELVTNFLAALLSLFKSRAELQAEMLVLRHQLSLLRRKARHRPRVTSWDRLVPAGRPGTVNWRLTVAADSAFQLRTSLEFRLL
jgi:hypothetical protein